MRPRCIFLPRNSVLSEVVPTFGQPLFSFLRAFFSFLLLFSLFLFRYSWTSRITTMSTSLNIGFRIIPDTNITFSSLFGVYKRPCLSIVPGGGQPLGNRAFFFYEFKHMGREGAFCSQVPQDFQGVVTCSFKVFCQVWAS